MHQGAGIAGNLQHGGVGRQRMDEHHVHAVVARIHDGAVKQPGAKAAAARMVQHRDAKLGAVRVVGVHGRRQVRQGNQLQPPVEDAEDLVPLEIEAVRVQRNLPVAGGIAKAQVAVVRVERQQVAGDALAVSGAEGADGHRHQGFFRL